MPIHQRPQRRVRHEVAPHHLASDGGLVRNSPGCHTHHVRIASRIYECPSSASTTGSITGFSQLMGHRNLVLFILSADCEWQLKRTEMRPLSFARRLIAAPKQPLRAFSVNEATLGRRRRRNVDVGANVVFLRHGWLVAGPAHAGSSAESCLFSSGLAAQQSSRHELRSEYDNAVGLSSPSESRACAACASASRRPVIIVRFEDLIKTH